MTTQDLLRRWPAFQSTNRFRRAIRKFEATCIPEDDVRALLAEAAFAPSSGNLQPYQLHWVREPSLKARLALACNGQRAAASAADLVVVVASPALGRHTAAQQLANVEASSKLGPESKAYYRKQLDLFDRILGVGSWPLWTPLVGLASLLRPSLSLLPVGHVGSRHWAARNAIFAAHTLMLGAAAKGIDSCPMEGFSAPRIARLLGIPRGAVIPIVIALGYRAPDARIEEQWRRSVADVVVTH
ncbi:MULTISPECIES: nitroreductase family protein [Ralstonia solanacearum species complex]|uniref:nitroreductase family protein n=1 Tax=Ralstonia solanacearum species complex TaxID=3116862 RepID=UPI000E56B8CC|nr:nitroreductase family protein [Ralstonia solanacearum]AXV78427.1 nitroreductase [Ralstonia solanacearum]AXV92453.1 nitroreductase [Ralstonia solanacearum]AXW77339.1 nitroreductase [Ralstonia solanacearum]BEU70647.1 nitroreductase family protein [Ralstonia pseudosolanacearum]